MHLLGPIRQLKISYFLRSKTERRMFQWQQAIASCQTHWKEVVSTHQIKFSDKYCFLPLQVKCWFTELAFQAVEIYIHCTLCCIYLEDAFFQYFSMKISQLHKPHYIYCLIQCAFLYINLNIIKKEQEHILYISGTCITKNNYYLL